MLRRTLLLTALAAGLAHAAAVLPYNESADAKAEIRQALATAAGAKHAVLVVFGANWCEDCRALDQALKSARNAELVGREFEVVKVDVGRFNRNLDVAKAYGDPIRKGIPAAVVLAADGQVLYATRAGELTEARQMSETGVYDFFDGVVRKAREKR